MDLIDIIARRFNDDGLKYHVNFFVMQGNNHATIANIDLWKNTAQARISVARFWKKLRVNEHEKQSRD